MSHGCESSTGSWQGETRLDTHYVDSLHDVTASVQSNALPNDISRAVAVWHSCILFIPGCIRMQGGGRENKFSSSLWRVKMSCPLKHDTLTHVGLPIYSWLPSQLFCVWHFLLNERQTSCLYVAGFHLFVVYCILSIVSMHLLLLY